MAVAARMKEAGSVILGLSVMAGLVAIGIGLTTGAAVFSVWVLKWTWPAFMIALIVSVVLLAPLSLVPRTRGFSAIGFQYASFAFGAILWVWGMSYTYLVWGLFPVIAGLMLLGVGVVPVAMFAALVHGDWSNLGTFVGVAAITFGVRALAHWLAQKADERTARLDRPEITARAYHLQE